MLPPDNTSKHNPRLENSLLFNWHFIPYITSVISHSALAFTTTPKAVAQFPLYSKPCFLLVATLQTSITKNPSPATTTPTSAAFPPNVVPLLPETVEVEAGAAEVVDGAEEPVEEGAEPAEPEEEDGAAAPALELPEPEEEEGAAAALELLGLVPAGTSLPP
jgi:hypothetical protein